MCDFFLNFTPSSVMGVRIEPEKETQVSDGIATSNSWVFTSKTGSEVQLIHPSLLSCVSTTIIDENICRSKS